MKRKVAEYLPFFGIVLVVCTASWLAGRTPPQAVLWGKATVRR
ncbi:hypothetical protein ACFMQL_00125 [Nonomuraea fastidiosa]|jgi:hypothetical protein